MTWVKSVLTFLNMLGKLKKKKRYYIKRGHETNLVSSRHHFVPSILYPARLITVLHESGREIGHTVILFLLKNMIRLSVFSYKGEIEGCSALPSKQQNPLCCRFHRHCHFFLGQK